MTYVEMAASAVWFKPALSKVDGAKPGEPSQLLAT